MNILKFVFPQKKLLDILIIISLVLIISYTWREIPSISFQGEGFWYFSVETASFNLNSPFDRDNYIPLREDLLARIVSTIFSRIFLDEMSGYFIFLYIEMILTVITMYFLVFVMIKNKLASFLAALFFGISYVANANMFASGGFQYFIQRGILLLPALLSLLLLVKFLQIKLFKFYFFSLCLYFLTVFLGFFATNFLPIIVLYPLVFLIVNFRWNWDFIIKMILIPVPFIIGTYQIIKNAGTLTNNTPKDTNFLITFWQIMTNFQNNLLNLLQQLAVLTLPFFWDKTILEFKISGVGVQRDLIKMFMEFKHSIIFSSDQILFIAEMTSVILYLFAFRYLWFNEPKWRLVTSTALGGFLTLLYLNLFLNPEQSLNVFTSSRYFYYPYSMGAIFWGLFFASIFLRKKGLVKKITIFIFLIWIGYNIFSVDRSFREEGWRFKANREMLEKIKEWSPLLKEKPYYVYFPGSVNTLGPGGLQFAQRFYGNPKSSYDFNEPVLPTLIKQNIRPEYIYVFRFDHQTHKVSDETNKWRTELKKYESKQYN